MIRGKFNSLTAIQEVEVNENFKLKMWVTENDGKDYLVLSPWVRYAKATEKEPTWKPKVGERGDGKTILIPAESIIDLKSALEEVIKDYAECLL